MQKKGGGLINRLNKINKMRISKMTTGWNKKLDILNGRNKLPKTNDHAFNRWMSFYGTDTRPVWFVVMQICTSRCNRVIGVTDYVDDY